MTYQITTRKLSDDQIETWFVVAQNKTEALQNFEDTIIGLRIVKDIKRKK